MCAQPASGQSALARFSFLGSPSPSVLLKSAANASGAEVVSRAIRLAKFIVVTTEVACARYL